MRVMRPSRGLATRRRASVAAALGLLLTVAACATAAPQGQAPAASHRHRGTARGRPGPHIDALAAAEPGAAGVGTGSAALPLAPAHRSGDAWGCVGHWFAGRWHAAPAQQYIGTVKKYLRERIWQQPDFQEP